MNIGFEKDTTTILKLKVNHPVAVNFFTTDSYASGYALPNETLDIWLDLDTTRKFRDIIEFKGKTASISTYLTKTKEYSSPTPNSNESINDYNKRVDSLTGRWLKTLDDFNHKNPLPSWFVKMEVNDIQYSGIYYKTSQFVYRYILYNQKLTRPNDYLGKSGVKIDNPDAKYSESYYNFLSTFYPNKFDTLLSPKYRTSDIFYESIKEQIKTAEKYLTTETKDLFLTRSISSFISVMGIENAISTNTNMYFLKLDSLITYARNNIKDTVLLNVLLAYQNDQYQIAEESQSLKTGSVAPDFVLNDLSGKTIRLFDFKGQLVVIDFWATWCAPCMKSIPDKNHLYNTLKNQGVVFINVCLDFEDQKWRSLIKENDFQGVHLICNNNWRNILYKSYYINAIPHYTLVNRNGIIIKNRVKSLIELEDLIIKHI